MKQKSKIAILGGGGRTGKFLVNQLLTQGYSVKLLLRKLVRVPFIEFRDATGNTTINLEDCEGTKITAGDIANFLIGQLTDTQYFQKACLT